VASTAADPGVAAALTRLRAQTDKMLTSIRHIVSELRPPVLDQYELTEALRRKRPSSPGRAGSPSRWPPTTSAR
jgi:signal transduction histidine kinase